MKTSVLLCGLLLLGKAAALQGQTSDEGSHPPTRARWELSLALRTWFSEAGSVFKGASAPQSTIVSDGDAFAPNLEFEALRYHFLLRWFYQFPTAFDGQLRFNDTSFDQRIDREDMEIAAGWRFPLRRLTSKTHVKYHFLAGYKYLKLVEDDANTEAANDDFQTRLRGPFLGATAAIQGKFRRRNWDLGLTAAFAHLEVEASQVFLPDVAFTETFDYEARGFLLDLSFNIYLRQGLQWMIGYKSQRYPARENTVPVTITLPNGTRRMPSVRTADFQAEGPITGFLWKF